MLYEFVRSNLIAIVRNVLSNISHYGKHGSMHVNGQDIILLKCGSKIKVYSCCLIKDSIIDIITPTDEDVAQGILKSSLSQS